MRYSKLTPATSPASVKAPAPAGTAPISPNTPPGGRRSIWDRPRDGPVPGVQVRRTSLADCPTASSFEALAGAGVQGGLSSSWMVTVAVAVPSDAPPVTLLRRMLKLRFSPGILSFLIAIGIVFGALSPFAQRRMPPRGRKSLPGLAVPGTVA